jgi:hypothetical protein
VKSLRQFADLTVRERRLLLRALFLVAALRLVLWTLPFRFARRLLSVHATLSPMLADIPVNRLSWAVRAAAKRIPQATCLTQALALCRLMADAGHKTNLRIGVAKDATSGLASHAWLEYQGDVLIGDNGELARYSPILALSPEAH